MNEKEKIEAAGVEAFVRLHNQLYGTSYKAPRMGDAPDAVLEDELGNQLNVEVTLTEDRPGDIQAALGRSDARKVVNKGERPENLGRASAASTLVARIKAKLSKRYGGSTVLLIRDTSGVEWDWNGILETAATAGLIEISDAFKGGIYILSRDCRTLTKLA